MKKNLIKTHVTNKIDNLLYVLILMASLLILSGSPLVHAETEPSNESNSKAEQKTESKTAEKRKQIVTEAVTALNETKNALKALDEEKRDEALESLEKATGKLEIVLVRDPELALAATHVTAYTQNLYASVDAVNKAKEKAVELLKDGRLQEARRLIGDLASETVISVENIPLATYPDAIKEAARLIDEGELDEAKALLQTTLNTLVVTEVIIPIPVVTSQILLEEAETLAEKNDRTKDENKRLSDLLESARKEIEFAQALGYGNKKDFATFYKEIDLIEKKTSGGQSGTGFFDIIKSSLSSMSTESQQSAQEEKSNKEVKK